MDDSHIRRPSGFRFIDLIVLVGIIVIVVALLLSGTNKARVTDGRTFCQNNLKSIALAIHDYASAFNNQLPPLSGAPVSGGIVYPQSVLMTLLPFVEWNSQFEALYNDSMSEPRGQTWNGIDRRTGSPIFSSGFVKCFACPTDPSNSTSSPTAHGWVGSSYAANAQLFGNKPRSVPDPTDTSWNELASDYTIGTIPDGTSYTIFATERFALAGSPGGTPCAWADPPAGGAGLGSKERDALGCALQTFVSNHGTFSASICGPATFFGSGTQEDPVGARGGDWKYPLPDLRVTPETASMDGRPQSRHTGGVVVVAMGDGSARYVSRKVSQVTWVQAIDPNDGQRLGEDW
jgi:hypothetical protein